MINCSKPCGILARGVSLAMDTTAGFEVPLGLIAGAGVVLAMVIAGGIEVALGLIT